MTKKYRISAVNRVLYSFEVSKTRQAKAGTEIKIGDIITIGFGDKQIKVRVTEIAETVKKDEAKEMYEFVE